MEQGQVNLLILCCKTKASSSEMLTDMFLHLLLCGPGAGGVNEPSTKKFFFCIK